MTVAELRNLFDEARPLVKQWLDLSEQFAAFRDAATEKGFDWSQIKALLKAQAMDERDGTDKHVTRIIERAEFASSYAVMLGLKVNENIFLDTEFPAAPVKAAATESELSPDHGKAPRGITSAIPVGSNGGGGHDPGRVNPPMKSETGVQRGQADEPTAPAPKGDEPRASEQETLASASGAVQGRCEPTAPPYPGDDDPLGPDLPVFLVRHPAVSA